MALALRPALLFLLLTLRQVRWWGLELGLVFAALAPVFAALDPKAREHSRRPRVWAAAAVGLALVPGVVVLVRSAIRPPGATPADIRRLVERDVAHWLRLRAGADRVVVAATPVITNHLVYHGGCQVLGTLYWENIDGLDHAAAILAAPSPEEAHELLRRFGVTHLVLPSWDDFAGDFVRAYRKVPSAQPVPPDAFLELLQRGGVPPWLRLVPCPLPAAEALQGHRVLVLEFTPEQTPPVATARLMDYLLEMGDTGPAAAAAARELERYPSDLRAQVALAGFHGQRGEADAFGIALERMRELLPQAAAFEVEDRIRLAVVLVAGGETALALAQAQLRETMARLDERALRRLSAGGLHDLQKLTEALGVEFPDAQLQQLARSLYPPMLRPSG